MNIKRIAVGFCMFVAFYSAASAQTLSDTAKEKRWAEQVIDTLFDGEAVWLNTGEHQFLGIEMAPENAAARQGIIVLHGIGVHPNWQQIIRPLRVGIAEQGWHTLSIQLPILANEATPEEYAPLFSEVPARIDAAINHLKKKGVRDIMLVAHSMGSAMSVGYLSGSKDTPVKAAVLIGLNAQGDSTPMNIADALKTISQPVLDVYGDEDLPGVIASAPIRADALFVAGHPASRQVRMEGANHFFDGVEEPLLELVLDWINSFH